MSAFCNTLPKVITQAEIDDVEAQFARFRFPTESSSSVSSTNQTNTTQNLTGSSPGVNLAELQDSLASEIGQTDDVPSGTSRKVDLPRQQHNLTPRTEGVHYTRADMSAEWGLCPDPRVFHYMFRDYLTVDSMKRLRYKVLNSTADTCTFLVFVDEDQSPTGYPTQMLGRIEKPRRGNPLFATAAFQKLARRRIRTLVPKVWGVGRTKTMDGTELHFLLSQHYVDVKTLADVWDEFDEPAQGAAMRQVVKAMSRLHNVRLGQGKRGRRDWEILSELPITEDHIHDGMPLLGGTRVGFRIGIRAFLMDRLRPINDPYTLYHDSDGSIVLQTTIPGLPAAEQHRVNFTPKNLELLEAAAVVCHDDIEPRNVLVRMKPGALNCPGFELVAIINWDSACIAPFASETACKDINLGLRNKNATWYENFKYATGCLLKKHPDLPGLESQEKLVRALHIADRCQGMASWLEDEVRTQKMWLQGEHLEMGENYLDGYVRKEVEDELEDFVSLGLEDEVLAEEARNRLGII